MSDCRHSADRRHHQLSRYASFSNLSAPDVEVVAFEDVEPHPSIVFAQNYLVSERAENRQMTNDGAIGGVP